MLKRLALSDELGGLDDAIERAAELAQIHDDYGVKYIRHQLEPHEQLY